MALQKDIQETFGGSDYFKNKDRLRKQVNNFVSDQRGMNTAKNAIAKNLRKGLRAKIGTAANAATGDLVKTAKLLGIENPLANAGLNMEAAKARQLAEYQLNENAINEEKAQKELEAKTGGAIDQTNTAGQQNQQMPQAGAAENAQPEQGKESALTKPKWADEVKNDRLFANVDFNDPKQLAQMQGKTREEVRQMLTSAKAARFMDAATKRGDILRNEEAAKEAAALDQKMFNQQIEFNNQVEGKVNSALEQAGSSLVKKSIKLPDGTFASGLSDTDLKTLRSAEEIAKAMNNDNLQSRFLQDIANENLKPLERAILATGELPPENFYIDSKGLQKSRDKERQDLVAKLNQELSNQTRGFETPSADYYSMTTEQKFADFQKRNKESEGNKALDVFDPLGKKGSSSIPFKYAYKDGIVSVVANKKYQSPEYKAYKNLEKQSKNYKSSLQTNARNQVLSEAQEKQRKLNEMTLRDEKYRAQRKQNDEAISSAYSLFGTMGSNPYGTTRY